MSRVGLSRGTHCKDSTAPARHLLVRAQCFSCGVRFRCFFSILYNCIQLFANVLRANVYTRVTTIVCTYRVLRVAHLLQ